MSAWIDRPSYTSVRADRAKVGAFWVDGVCEWWGVSPLGATTGPHATREAAKQAVDAALPLEIVSRRTWKNTAAELIIGFGIALVLFLVFP